MAGWFETKHFLKRPFSFSRLLTALPKFSWTNGANERPSPFGFRIYPKGGQVTFENDTKIVNAGLFAIYREDTVANLASTLPSRCKCLVRVTCEHIHSWAFDWSNYQLQSIGCLVFFTSLSTEFDRLSQRFKENLRCAQQTKKKTFTINK
jgi:hypothetical protein